MTALPQPQQITIAEYLQGEEHSPVKHEYLGGVVHAMSGGTNRHGIISGNAFGSFFNQLRGKPCQPFNSDTKVRIELPDQIRFYYPDAMVVCHPNPLADTYQEHPVVVIEVLSDSTRRTDMGEKRDAYLAIPSLKVLLLVEPDASSVTVLRRRTEGGFATELHSGMEAVIPLPEIGAELEMAALYDRAGIPV